jgi:hypothetical protein
MLFPSIFQVLGYYAAGSEPVNSAQGDPAEILENKGQTPRIGRRSGPPSWRASRGGGKSVEGACV